MPWKRRSRSAIVAKAQRGPDSLKPLLKRFTGKQVHVLQTTKTEMSKVLLSLHT